MGTIRYVTVSGKNNCAQNAVFCQLSGEHKASLGIESGQDLRKRVISHIERNSISMQAFLAQAEELSYRKPAAMMVGEEIKYNIF